jgi:ribosome-binding ATPase YchF (GTP1/OBG family)
MVFIEKRFENIDKKIKRTKELAAAREKDILAKMKEHLEKEMPLRLLELNADEAKIILNYPFATRKAMLIALNISEEDLKNTSLIEKLKKDSRLSAIDIMQVSAKVECEIAGMDSEQERSEFLKELAIKESAINVLARLCIKALDLISFFTVGPDEVRQRLIRSGSTAPEAAGAVHTDMQKGFIRAEVIKYNDLAALGSEAKVKETGKLYLKGKDYIVEDGDIINIRFNV